MVRKAVGKVRIYSRHGADFTDRFPRIVEAVNRLNVTSVLIDGEGVVYDRYGMPDFALIHSNRPVLS
jgi:bifunctional non-homologous end joining protein LigD